MQFSFTQTVPPMPSIDEVRAAALGSYEILNTTPEHAFDRLTRLARMALDIPIVLISLTDRDRQWFKSRQGLDACEAPRSIAFCAHAIQQVEPFVIADTTRDPRFSDNPLVTGDPFIRFYVGIPLRMRDGHIIGTLCAMDMRPRTVTREEMDVLQDLASMVIDAIELRRIATDDSLTGALTRRGFDAEIGREFTRAKRSRQDLSLIAVDIDHFKSVNDRYGHAVGDLVLKSLVRAIKEEIRASDIVARMGGEEFVVALPDTNTAGAQILADRIRERIAGEAVQAHGHTIHITASFGISVCDAGDASWKTALEKADAALYNAKRNGRNKAVRYDDLAMTAVA